MTVETAAVPRRTIPVRLRWVCGLLAFAATCYAVFGWLWGDPFRDGAGNRLVFYAGVQEGHVELPAFALGGLATGTALAMVVLPVLGKIKNFILDLVLGLVFYFLACAIVLLWLAACLLVWLGTGMSLLTPVTSPEGQRVLLAPGGISGGLRSTWVPHSRFMYVEVPNSGFHSDEYASAEDCTLQADNPPWILTCQGIDVILDGKAR